jgi:protein-tyrosine phosphatase
MWPFSRPELRILMVCTANVCRSPAAEALLRHHLKQMGLAKRIAVSSAGTAVGAQGRKPDPRVVAILEEMGVSARGIRAQPLEQRCVARSGEIFVMEAVHRDVLLERFPEALGRVSLLDHGGRDIPDPYFGNKSGVRSVVEHIHQLTRDLADVLAQRLEHGNHGRPWK